MNVNKIKILEYLTYSEQEHFKRYIDNTIFLAPVYPYYHICESCVVGFLSSMHDDLEMLYGSHYSSSDGTLLTEEEQEDLILQKEMNDIDTDIESLESIQFLEDTCEKVFCRCFHEFLFNNNLLNLFKPPKNKKGKFLCVIHHFKKYVLDHDFLYQRGLDIYKECIENTNQKHFCRKCGIFDSNHEQICPFQSSTLDNSSNSPD